MNFVWRTIYIVPALLALSACSNDSDQQDPRARENKMGTKPQASSEAIAAPAEKALGTPMAERIATLGLLNKRTGVTRDIELKPGQDIRIGKVVVRLRACERTAPWETYADEGAFVQLIVNERPPGTAQKARWRQVFSGWLFKNNPAANVVPHGIYDVWVKQCKMSFPGEEDVPKPLTPADGKTADDASGAPPATKPEDKKPSRAPQSPPPAADEDEEDAPAVEEETIVT
jgi:hypothetical protein